MDDLIKTLVDTRSPALLVLIAAMVAIFSMREYTDMFIKLRKARREKAIVEVPEQRAELIVTDPKRIVDSHFRILERYYDLHLGEYRLVSRATMVIASLGFIVILVGVGFALSGNISVGVLTSIAGAVAEGVSALFFSQNRLFMSQIAEYHKKLVSTQYLLTSISLAESLQESSKEIEIKRIIDNLLFLSNELHGSSSDHLFHGVSVTAPTSHNSA